MAGQLVAANNVPCVMDLDASSEMTGLDHSMHERMAASSDNSELSSCCDSMALCNIVSGFALVFSPTDPNQPIKASSNVIESFQNATLPTPLDSLYKPPIVS